MRSSRDARRVVVTVALWVCYGQFPGPSGADEPRAEIRLPELAGAAPLRRAGNGLYLNISAKVELYRVNAEKNDVLTGGDAVKWVKTAGESTMRQARIGGAEAFVAVRADRATPAAEVMELARSSGIKTLEFRVLKPAAAAGGLPTEERLPFARSGVDPKTVLGVALVDSKKVGGKGECQITRTGAEPESVELAQLGGRLKELLGNDQVVALVIGKSWSWSSAVEALALCHEAGVKELVLRE